MTNEQRCQAQSARLVLQDLIDCLLAEGFFGAADTRLLAPEEWRGLCAAHPGLAGRFPTLPEGALMWQWTLAQAPLHCVLAPVVRGIGQPLRCVPGTAALGYEAGQAAALDPAGLMRLLVSHAPDPLIAQNPQGAAMFADWVDEAVRQGAWSLEHRIDTSSLLERPAAACFQILEQCASLRDRPFHPVAKPKKGFSREDYFAYMAEFGNEVPLRWVAVDRGAIAAGEGVEGQADPGPEQFLLDEAQRGALRQEMRRRGLLESHVALPVHPWQLRHTLPVMLGPDLRDGVCVALDLEHGGFLPTSSVRSLAPTSGSPHYLKLPLGIYSLGASRYLPAIKMINGQRSERLLRQAMARDSVLAERVFLCDETKWWAYLPAHADLFDEGPRHLSAMVRSYPSELVDDPACRLVPMAALGVAPAPGQTHFFDAWLRFRGMASEGAQVLILFREVCERFFDINLRMFRLGMLAEVHGQNAVLVWRAGRVEGLLLRDHDSLRIHVPWLERHGMADPAYRLKPGHANTLYHDTPGELLFYLQTLAIQVNLRAIAEVLAQRYGIAEADLWAVLRKELDLAVDRVDFPAEARAMLRERLFEAPQWPLKLLVRPMIERAAGPGSMPFGKSVTANPFHAASARQDHVHHPAAG
ncbi:IucA/IucC family protein [Massilia sp. DD77]|uniref:IucA/IucC family protein n=1 Tax=Massilia sp. DD77 TaxID=3109349 RepID=UPI002FFF5F61